MMKYKVLIIVFAIVLISEDMMAQKKRKRPVAKKEEETIEFESEEKSLKDNLAFDIRIGNIGLNQGFSASLKPGIGYKFTEALSAGVGGRLFYDYYNVFGPDDLSQTTWGGFGYGRLKLGESIYLQAEYAITQFDNTLFGGFKETLNYPAVGGGYVSGVGPFKYGLELILPLNSVARDYLFIEYWININYNF